MTRPRVTLKKVGRCHLGAIEVPMRGGTLRVQTLGWDPSAALKRAAATVIKATDNPAIYPFLPPQVTAAVLAAKAISKLSKGGLKKAAKEGTPDVRKLASALLRKQQEAEAAAAAEAAASSSEEIDAEELAGPSGLFQKFLARKREIKKGTRDQRGKTRTAPRRTSVPAEQQEFGGQRTYGTDVPRPAPYYPGAPGAPGTYPPGTYPPGTYPPGTYPPGTIPQTPAEQYMNAAAMAAWGQQAFDQQAVPYEEQYPADDYFQEYEGAYYEGYGDTVPDDQGFVTRAPGGYQYNPGGGYGFEE